MKLLIGILMFALAVPPLSGQSGTAKPEPLVVVRNGLYGYIDHSGTVIIEPQFLWGFDFEYGYGEVYVCGRYALVDKSGKIFPIDTPRIPKGLFRKKIGNKVGFVDEHDKWSINPIFDDAWPFSDGLAAVSVDAKWGFIDTSGRFAIAPRFDAAFYFNDGVGQVEVGDTTILIDKSGKELASGYGMSVGLPAEGRVPVSRDDKHGYLDQSGNAVIPLTFDNAKTFSEGLAAVRKGSKWGYIDKKGRLVIPFQFDSADEFGAGLAPVTMGNESGFIDHTGAFAFKLDFESAPGFWGLESISDVSIFWTKSEEFGYVNTKGKVIWGPIKGSPDHAPILGWDEEGKRKSCEVVSDAVRREVAALPPEVDE